MNSRLRRMCPPNSSYIILALILCTLILSSCMADAQQEESSSDNPVTELSAENPVPVPDDTISAGVSEKAGVISGKYGVRILTGSDVPQIFTDYTVTCLNDPDKITEALNELDRTLSIYPPGFFTSVKEGYCDSITICLAQDLYAINDSTHLESAHAFTTVQDDTIWLVLNAGIPLRRGTLIHEITHVIDYRLLSMNQLLETEWNRLNPPSFSYYNSYLDEDGTDLRISGSKEYTSFVEEDSSRIWFYDPYSKTFAMEDRARLMEKLLENYVLPVDTVPEEKASPDSSLPEDTLSEDAESTADSFSGDSACPDPDPPVFTDRCFSSPHIRAKLRFYFYTLRQAFENARWPEETVWESALRSTDP